MSYLNSVKSSLISCSKTEKKNNPQLLNNRFSVRNNLKERARENPFQFLSQYKLQEIKHKKQIYLTTVIH